MSRWTEIRYKCACMREEASLQMKERRFNEEIEDFMERVKRALASDHKTRSPFCSSIKSEYVKIPVPDGVVGKAEGGTA